jgi:hypothetical protein
MFRIKYLNEITQSWQWFSDTRYPSHKAALEARALAVRNGVRMRCLRIVEVTTA